MTANQQDDPAPSKAVVSEADADAIIAAHAPPVQVLEVVSDTYADPASIEHHQSHEAPGFFQISSDRFETAPIWNLRSDDTIMKVLEEYAISPGGETRILLFDNIQINCGKAKSRFDASARIYSVLKYFGVQHVSVIMDNAMDKQFEDEYAANHPEIIGELALPPAQSPAELMARSALTFHRTTQVKTGQHTALADRLHAAATNDVHLLHPGPVEWTDQMIKSAPSDRTEFVPHDTVVDLLAGKAGPYKILDARSAEEHAGDVTGYEYVTASGRIPSSESMPNADYQLSADDGLSDVLNRLQQHLTAKDLAKDDRIIWYCGTGWRAARMCILTQLLGYNNSDIYEGGWNEWYRRHPEDIIQQASSP
jgi:3-mercaptopyruvate sulfurtransferase SseA